MLRRLARASGARLFVETGTYVGQTVFELRNDFDRLYSIELSQELHDRARRRLGDFEQIELIQGDSGVELGVLMARIDRTCLFWLDGHWSGGITARGSNDTPVLEELEHILASPLRHVVVVDDARLFGADPAYPSLGDLHRLVVGRSPSAHLRVENDAVVVVPAGAAGA